MRRASTRKHRDVGVGSDHGNRGQARAQRQQAIVLQQNRTLLFLTLRDCGIRSLILAGIALEIGIEPTCRHAADLGIIPILVRDACGAGNPEAADKCVATLEHMGDTIITDLNTISELLTTIDRPKQ